MGEKGSGTRAFKGYGVLEIEKTVGLKPSPYTQVW